MEAVKKKRRSSKKSSEEFSFEQMKGEVTTLKAPDLYVCTTPQLDSDLVMTPYSDYVPIGYLSRQWGGISTGRRDFYAIYGALKTYARYNVRNPLDDTKLQKITQDLIKKPCGDIILKVYQTGLQESDLPYGIEELNIWLEYDNPVQFTGGYTGSNAYSDMMNDFKRWYFYKMGTRSYTGYVGAHSVFLQEESGKHRPAITLVTLRENVLYHKMNMALNGTIDLSKCFFLVDKELDETSHPFSTFRTAFYNKFIVPYLATLKVDIWKVPHTFIKEKCFLPDFKIKEGTIKEQQKQKEDLIKAFCKSLKEKYKGYSGEAASISIDPGFITVDRDGIIIEPNPAFTTTVSTGSYTITGQAGLSALTGHSEFSGSVGTAGGIRPQPVPVETDTSLLSNLLADL